ncbi:hypothetical protein KXW24_008187, partial [Aspergillus fumigatus]
PILAGSIMALAATVASRSKLIPDGIRQSRPQEANTQAKNEKVPMDGPNHSFYCCRVSKELPRYLLVDLNEAINNLLNGIGHFAHTQEEYAELNRKAHALAALGSLSHWLYNQLRAKADDPSVESWIAGPLLKALHLKQRYPLVPFSSFLGTHFNSPVPHSQAEKLKPDFLGERPNCGYSLTGLFNALRELNMGCDKMMRNTLYIKTLEESIFVICLDDDSLVTPCRHRKSGTIFEHSMIDFMTTSQISQRLQGAIDTMDPENDNTS